MSKVIFVVFSDSFQELTFVRNGLLDDLISRNRYQCVIIVPSELARTRIKPHFDSLSTDIFVYESRPAPFYDHAIRVLLACKYEKYAGPYSQRRRKSARSKVSVCRKIKSRAAHIVARIIPERVLLFIQNRLLSDRFLDGLFKRYRPGLTILSWGGAYEPCPLVIRSARKFDCKTISVDASWDCMDELAFIPKVDRLLVWNEAMKEEAVTKHRCDPRRVSAIGLLRCDCYRQEKYMVTRATFFERHGLNQSRRLVTLVINRGDPEIYCRVVNSLLKADAEKRLSHPIQVYVRLAPWSDPEAYNKLKQHPLVRVQAGYGFKTGIMVQEKEIRETVNLLQHTDILVSVLSTFILESAFFTTPNISLRFPEFCSLYERDFLAPLYQTGGVTFVDDLASLLEAVNRYLATPQQDAHGREAILQCLCNGGDGMAKSRAILEINAF